MAITVPVTGADISASTFGVPVANQLNAYFFPTWTNFAFGTEWQQQGGATACSYFLAGKLVVLRGLAQAKIATAGGSVVVVLPAAIRPVSLNAVTTSAAGPCDVYMEGATLNLAKSTPAVSGSWISLDGLSWYTP